MKRHNFDEKREEGEKWEGKIKSELGKKIFISKALEQISFEKSPGKQHKGIDQILHKKKTENIDVKTRDYYAYRYNDILIETKSSTGKYQNVSEGWLYKEDTDIIVYVWKNESGRNLIDGYFLIWSDELTDWIKENIDGFDRGTTESERNGKVWETEFVTIPIDRFPENLIINFNPTLSSKEQSKLQDYSVGGEQ